MDVVTAAPEPVQLRAAPEHRLLFHFTHVGNVAALLAEGRLLADAAVTERGDLLRVEVGQRGIKERRRGLAVPSGPGGHVCDYVPFYFAPRSPMLYVIEQGQVEAYQQGQEPIAYLVSRVDRIQATGRPIVFSDRNCAVATARFSDDLSQLDDLVDWPVMQDPMWNDTAEHPDRKQRRMAEMLVHRELPVTALLGLAVMNGARREEVAQVVREAGADLPVHVRRGWYY